MAGYDYFLPDTSTRQKISNTVNSFLPDINPYYQQIQQQGNQALQQAFGAAQQNIGAQFSPMFRLAQARLGGQPLLADSGYANRLNRQLQQNAFGQLSNAYSSAAANQAQGQQEALARLIQQRLGMQGDLYSQILGSAQKKQGGIGGAIGSVLGAGAGILGGSYLSGLGSKWAK